MSEPTQGPGTPLLGRHQVGPGAGYRRIVGAHRAPGTGGPPRGYLFTVALLAGTASMPILAAFSAGSATVGNSALPDSSTPFIPTPSVGPVVIPLPDGAQPAVLPTRAAPTSLPPPAPLLRAAPALPVDPDLGSQRRSLPGAPAPRPVPRPTRATPTSPPCPSPSASPSATTPATPGPTSSPTAAPTNTFSDPAIDPSPTASVDPTGTTSPAGSPPPTSPSPEESPESTLSSTADPDPSPSAATLRRRADH